MSRKIIEKAIVRKKNSSGLIVDFFGLLVFYFSYEEGGVIFKKIYGRGL